MNRRRFLKGTVPAGVSLATSGALLNKSARAHAAENSSKPKPAGDRKVATKGFAAYPPSITAVSPGLI